MIIGLDINNKKLICSECGSTINGKYYRYDKSEKILCDICNRISLNCDICNTPSSLLDRLSGLKICPSCLSVSDKCERCGKKLSDDNRKYINGISAFYCRDCFAKTDCRCEICNRPLKSKSQLIKTNTNQMICEDCNKNYIFDKGIAVNILKNLSKIIENKFDFESNTLPPIYLSTDIELKYLKKIKSKKIINNSEKDSILAYDGNYLSIYILAGLPIEKFLKQVIIEYLIFWSFTNNSINYNGNIELSLAKLLTIKILNLLGYQKERRELVMKEAMDKNKSNLIKLLTIEKNSGIKGVIDFALYRKRKVV